MLKITQPVTSQNRALNELFLPPEPVSFPHWPSSHPHRIGVKKIRREMTSEIIQSLMRKWGPLPGEAGNRTWQVCSSTPSLT